MPKEKEVVIDLSGKIKFSDTLYISLGTFLLSMTIIMIQMLIILSSHDWIFTSDVFAILLNFFTALRSSSKANFSREQGLFTDGKIE